MISIEAQARVGHKNSVPLQLSSHATVSQGTNWSHINLIGGTMLRLEKATLGNFGAQDMMGLITSRGWEAVLPDALDDNHLLIVSDQLRDLLCGNDCNGDHEVARAALPLALLLLSKAGAKRSGDSMEVGLGTLQEALCLLSTAVDREIVNRMLQRQDATPIGVGLVHGLQILVQGANEHVGSPCHG